MILSSPEKRSKDRFETTDSPKPSGRAEGRHEPAPSSDFRGRLHGIPDRNSQESAEDGRLTSEAARIGVHDDMETLAVLEDKIQFILIE